MSPRTLSDDYYIHGICSCVFLHSLQIQRLDNFKPATLAEVCAVHDHRYPAALEQVAQQLQQPSEYTIVESSPTYVTSSSYKDALQVTPAALLLLCLAEVRDCRLTGETHEKQQFLRRHVAGVKLHTRLRF